MKVNWMSKKRNKWLLVAGALTLVILAVASVWLIQKGTKPQSNQEIIYKGERLWLWMTKPEIEKILGAGQVLENQKAEMLKVGYQQEEIVVTYFLKNSAWRVQVMEWTAHDVSTMDGVHVGDERELIWQQYPDYYESGSLMGDAYQSYVVIPAATEERGRAEITSCYYVYNCEKDSGKIVKIALSGY